jgi:SAM-dependent methyltransferase
MERFFEVKDDHFFNGSNLSLNRENSILMNFRGGRNEFSYKMLLVLELYQVSDYNSNPKLITDIQKLTESGIDKIVIWTAKRPQTDTLYLLKKFNVNLIYFKEQEIEDVKVISNFFPLKSTNDYNYAVVLNQVSHLLVKRLSKLFHIVLSEIAAPTYDKDYGKDANIGTKSIMAFEEKIIEQIVKRTQFSKTSKPDGIAVDVGCGTGRHCFKIYNYYKQIYGFDFSPKMIEKANETRKEKNIDNIIFSVADLEYEEIIYEDEFRGKVDFVIASFGMGSFIEDSAKIFRRYYQWLKPGGEIIISFYNKNSIILQITPNWRDTSLSAHIDKENSTLQVKLSDDIIFQIYCKPYDENVLSICNALFKTKNIYTYPTTMALLPNSLLRNEKAFNIFSRIDEEIASEAAYNSGHYVLYVGQKPIEPEDEKNGFERVLEIINNFSIKDFQIVEHEQVLSVEDVKNVLKMDALERMIKTIIFRDKKHKRYVAVSIPSNKKIDTLLILNYINSTEKFNRFDQDGKIQPINSINFKFASEREIMKLGFPIGGISPFGYNPNYDVISVVDNDLLGLEGYLYTGIGDNKKTLKLHIEEFRKLVSGFEKIKL